MGSSQWGPCSYCKSYLPKVRSRLYYTKYMVVSDFTRIQNIQNVFNLLQLGISFYGIRLRAQIINCKGDQITGLFFVHIIGFIASKRGCFQTFLAVFISKVLPLTSLGIKFHFLGLFDSGRIHSDAQTFLKSACLTKGSSCK